MTGALYLLGAVSVSVLILGTPLLLVILPLAN